MIEAKVQMYMLAASPVQGRLPFKIHDPSLNFAPLGLCVLISYPLQLMELRSKAKPAQMISSATLQDRSDITSEREQLLHRTERPAECTRCGDTDHDEGSTRCQFCGHDKFGPKQRCGERLWLFYPPV